MVYVISSLKLPWRMFLSTRILTDTAIHVRDIYLLVSIEYVNYEYLKKKKMEKNLSIMTNQNIIDNE